MLHFKVDITILIVINIKNLFLLQMIIFLFCVWFKYPIKYPIIYVFLRTTVYCELNILKLIQIFVQNIFGCLCDYIWIIHESPASKRTENNRFNFIVQSHIQNPPKPFFMNRQQLFFRAYPESYFAKTFFCRFLVLSIPGERWILQTVPGFSFQKLLRVYQHRSWGYLTTLSTIRSAISR